MEEAKLATAFDSDENPQRVTHSIRVGLPSGSPRTRHETWRRKKYLGCGGLGAVFLERCEKVDVTWDDSECEGDGDGDGDGDELIGALRAVKQLSKPPQQEQQSQRVDASGLLGELRGSLFFNRPEFEYHFVKSFGWYESASAFFIAMEYVAGGDLQSYLMKHGKIKSKQVKFISKQLLWGLRFMHENGFVHRDLKPANLLIKSRPSDGGSSGWWIKITDFGISKMTQKSRALSSNSNTVCGTLGFMAPELFGFLTPRDRAAGVALASFDNGVAADIWAAGETIFRMLTGVASFGDDLSLLSDYVAGNVAFPDAALRAQGLNDAGIFVRALMQPSPFARHLGMAADKNLSWPEAENIYSSWAARHVHSVKFAGHAPPKLEVSARGHKFVILAGAELYVWDLLKRMPACTGRVYAVPSPRRESERTHVSISPNGRFVCVTSVGGSSLPLVLDGGTLELDAEPRDEIGRPWNQSESKMSAWSPDGETLVTACGDMLSQISVIDGWRSVNQYRSAVTEGGDSRGRGQFAGVRALQFTEDGERLIAAYAGGIVIKDTTCSCWANVNVFEYPCTPSPCSSVSISQTGVIACGSTMGTVWIWTMDMACWARRMLAEGHAGRPTENVHFSREGVDLFFNHRGESVVRMLKALPLEDVGHCLLMRGKKGGTIGQTVVFSDGQLGATALGGTHGATVVFWEATSGGQ
ncbi:unnamed protein product [Discula destructiva]